MGLDIYSGKLTRYYCRDWKNLVQQFSEEKGMKCVMTDTSGNEIKPVEDKAEIENIRGIVTQWSDCLAAAFEPPLPTPLWDEKTECDYYTDKPDWEAYEALMLLQACHSMNCPLPEYIERGWTVFDESLFKKAQSKEIANSLLRDVTVWLPIPYNMIFKASLPTGDEVSMSTVSLLKQELEELNQEIWKADEATILSWRNDKYYFPVEQKESKPLFGFLVRKNKNKKEKYRTEDMAQSAYSMLYQAVRFAEENQVPILLDF